MFEIYLFEIKTTSHRDQSVNYFIPSGHTVLLGGSQLTQ